MLLVKQQHQLKAMQRTLEDEENYDTTSNDIDLNRLDCTMTRSMVRDKEVHQSNTKSKTGPSISQINTDQIESSSDEASLTEKHVCNNSKSPEHGEEETQEVEFTGTECNDNPKGAFGSDINGIDTVPFSCGDAVGTEQIPETEGVGTPQILEGGALETEQVLETESLEGRNIDLNKGGEAMQVDNEANEEETPQKNFPESRDPMEDTEGGGTLKTADLLASEAAGSWACSTAPSVHGGNDSLSAAPVLHDSSSLVAESQNIPCSKSEAAAKRNHERRALSEMIGIVAPDLKEQFSRAVESDDRVGSEGGVASDSDTEDCSDNEEQEKEKDDIAREVSDAETVGSDGAASDAERDEDDGTQDDSVG